MQLIQSLSKKVPSLLPPHTTGQCTAKALSTRKPRPPSSLVLSTHLRQRQLPPWTSYFVSYRDVRSDQRGLSHFNWQVDGANYHILRTGCWPYIKYHCTKRPPEDLALENRLLSAIKLINLGIPCLAYGAAAVFLISCEEDIHTPEGTVKIYFLYPEDIGAKY